MPIKIKVGETLVSNDLPPAYDPEVKELLSPDFYLDSQFLEDWGIVTKGDLAEFICDAFLIYSESDYLTDRQRKEFETVGTACRLYFDSTPGGYTVHDARGSSSSVLKFVDADSVFWDSQLLDLPPLSLKGVEYDGCLRVECPDVVKPQWSDIKNYTYKMDSTDFKFFRTMKLEQIGLWFGLELEVCSEVSGAELQFIAQQVEPRQDPFFILKHDVSIKGVFKYRYEIVTVPCTPKYLKTNFNLLFEKLEKLAEAKEKTLAEIFTVDGGEANGLHIHVDRKAFATKSSLRKFSCMWLYPSNVTLDFLNRFGKRESSIGVNPAGEKPAYYGPYPDFPRRFSFMKTGTIYGTDRYRNLNVTRQTAEVRAFKGNFEAKHVVNCIDFTEFLVDFCNTAGHSDFIPIKIPSAIRRRLATTSYENLKEIAECA